MGGDEDGVRRDHEALSRRHRDGLGRAAASASGADADAVGRLALDRDAARVAARRHRRLLDRDERGVLRREAEAEAEVGDRVANVRLLGAGRDADVVASHEVVDLAARPEGREHVVARLVVGERDLDVAHDLAAVGRPSKMDDARLAPLVPAADDDRLRAEEVRDTLRVDVGHLKAAPVDRDVDEQRVADAPPEAARGGRAVVVERDVLDLASPLLGHPVEQEAVHRVADAEGEDAGVRVLLDLADDLHVVADVAVGHEADDPHVVLIVGRLERRADGLHHLGPARAVARFEELARGLQVLGRGPNGLGEEDVRVAGKGDQVEGVVGVESVEREADALLGLLDRETGHRARRVDNEDELLRRDALGGDAVGRLEDEGEEAAALVVVREERVLDLPARDLVGEDEVAVRDLVALREPHDGAVRRGALDLDLVERRDHLLDGQAGVDRDFERDVVAGTTAGRHRRYDLRRLRAALRRGHVAPADNHRKDEAVGAVLVRERLDVGDDDLDARAREDVGDRLREDVRPLLFEQARDLARRSRRLVGGSRLLALLDLGANDAVADAHRHAVDRRAVREREEVDGLDRSVEGVLELLGDGHARDEAAHVGLHVGMFERARAARRAFTIDGFEPALCDLRSLRALTRRDRIDEAVRGEKEAHESYKGKRRSHGTSPDFRASVRCP